MKELRCSGPLLLSKKGAELDFVVVVEIGDRALLCSPACPPDHGMPSPSLDLDQEFHILIKTLVNLSFL